MAKKGENLATREDVAEITTTVKEIESQISDQVWSKQRRWELKKEVVISAIGKLAETHSAMRRLEAVYRVKTAEQPQSAALEMLLKHQSAAMDNWQIATREFTKSLFIIDTVCGDDLAKWFYGVDDLLGKAVVDILAEKDVLSVNQITQEVRDGIKTLIVAIRKELAHDEALILPKK